MEMKLRNVSLVLFLAACGGGKDPPVVVVDSPTGGDGPVGFPNAANDMLLITFGDNGLTPTFTPDPNDQPDNQESPLTISNTAGVKIAGEMANIGDRSDEYFERDTYLIQTGADTNQMTIRLQWDGGTSDHDYALFREPAAGETEADLVLFSSGTLISDGVDDDGVTPVPEFETFTVDPNTKYWLWTGVYNTTAAGGAPTLPSAYDFAIYGDVITTSTLGNCDVNESGDGATDTNNAIEAFDGTGTKVANNATVAPGTAAVYCGVINSQHFTPDPDDPVNNPGVVDVDAYALNISLDGDILVTITGATQADNAALVALGGV
jgi:hypothetical protein